MVCVIFESKYILPVFSLAGSWSQVASGIHIFISLPKRIKSMVLASNANTENVNQKIRNYKINNIVYDDKDIDSFVSFVYKLRRRWSKIESWMHMV